MPGMTSQELLDRLLEIRGFKTTEDRDFFLNPRYESMHDSLLMHDMQKAVERIIVAINAQEKICIYSDYDADGIPGGVILHDFFKKVGYENFLNYIPHRHSEGYGVHKDALQSLVNQGVKLVITVDVGITAVPEIEYGNSLGLEIIVTDHHEPLDVLPNAYAIVNPKLGNYPDRMLCGAAVAFKLVQALTKTLRLAFPAHTFFSRPHTGYEKEGVRVSANSAGLQDGWEKWLLDMAGLATLSDMVPLVGENRIIAYYGMKVLQKTKRPGLRSLFEKSGISLNHLTETDIVFSVTPRLNAASRMAHPDDAFRLLATEDKKEGLIAAEHLSVLNDSRKKIVATIMRDVHKKLHLRKSDSAKLPSIVVVGDPAWSAGVLGLVASKITEEYGVTTFVWGSEGEIIKGSCRSIGDISVVQLMQTASELLIQFGGHEEAGGFTTDREKVHFLEKIFNENYGELKKELAAHTKAMHDLELMLSDVTMEHYHTIRKLAPFGMGNETPVFAFKDVLVKDVKQFGKTMEHLEVQFGSGLPRAISWYAKPDSFSERIESNKMITLLAEFDYSVFRGKEELRLKIVDVVKELG